MSKTPPDGTTRPSLWQALSVGSSGTETDRRNNKRFTLWCLAWAVFIIAASWIVKSNEQLPAAAAWAIALSPNVLAIGALMAYLRLLRMNDELQRKIQIEGLAVGFGTGWLFAIGYLVLETAGAPEMPLTALIMVMTGGWMLGTLLAFRHYR